MCWCMFGCDNTTKNYDNYVSLGKIASNKLHNNVFDVKTLLINGSHL